MSAPRDQEPLPRTIGPYEIGGRVASGGMAHVFVARRIGTRGRPVALKRPRADMLEDSEFIRMFLDEARLAFHVKSVHTLAVTDCGADTDGTPYYTMPLVVGASLRRLAALVPRFDTALAVEIAIQIANGLHDAHIAQDDRGNALAIVHRDVSPHNVLLDVDGRVRVADFGIARAAQRLTKTSTGQVKGKIGYLSPEQAQSRPVDRRSDVFSLGIVSWELLTGQRLFPKRNLVEQHRRLLHAPLEHPSDLVKDVPRDVGDVVMAALVRDLDRRTPDAATFGEHLRAIAPRRVGADVIGRFVAEHARDEVARLSSIIEAVSAHGDTLHTLALPRAALLDVDEATRVTGDGEVEATTVTPPRPPVEPPRRGWLGRLLGRR